MVITARPASSYRSVAGAVRTVLLRLQHGSAIELDDLMVDRIDTIRDLLQLGSQFGPHPEQHLDTSYGSSPAKVDLARELAHLAPKRMEGYDDDQFDMQRWVAQATEVLDSVKSGSSWNQLSPNSHQFVELELEPFLRDVLATPPEPGDL